MPAFTLLRLEPDIALLTFDLPGKGANILSTPVLNEFSAHLDELERDTACAGLVIRSGKPGMFIAGADLREFAAAMSTITSEQTTALCRRGQSLFQRLSRTHFVTVAAIDGICVGGGAELAIWCDRRIMSTNPKTEFGFPEVKIGLFPGWGGTVRAPRVVGLGNAVELITSGESADARTASALGLVSDVVPAEQLLEAASRLIRDEQRTRRFIDDRRHWNEPLHISPTELAFLGAAAAAVIQQQTKGQYPAPAAALEMMLETSTLDAETALLREAEGMAQLFGSPVNRALINVFFLNDRIKKDTGLDRGEIAPRSIRSVGVIGGGIMGAGIAAANVKRELSVTLLDADESALAKGVRSVMEDVTYDKKLKRLDVERALRFAPLIRTCGALGEFATCDLVLEAVVENADVKRQIYARLEPQMRPDAVLASNTSTIPITQLAAGLARPDQFCGIHFFNPVRKMQLVEVIRGAQTSDATVATAVAYAKYIGKLPIVVNDGPGFLVNRLLFPYMNEAIELFCEGVGIAEIERAAKSFGMPMGPITLYDMVGIDTAFYAGRTMWEAFPDRIVASPVLPALIKAGRLGQKNGLGFFSYRNKRNRAEPDPAVDQLLAAYRREPRPLPPDEITLRLFLPMLLEATRVLQDKIVRDPRDIDFGLIFGLGFPAFRGGLLCWADQVGAARIVSDLQRLEYVGPRAQPTPWLLEMARSGRKFYA